MYTSLCSGAGTYAIALDPPHRIALDAVTSRPRLKPGTIWPHRPTTSQSHPPSGWNLLKFERSRLRMSKYVRSQPEFGRRQPKVVSKPPLLTGRHQHKMARMQLQAGQNRPTMRSSPTSRRTRNQSWSKSPQLCGRTLMISRRSRSEFGRAPAKFGRNRWEFANRVGHKGSLSLGRVGEEIPGTSRGLLCDHRFHAKLSFILPGIVPGASPPHRRSPPTSTACHGIPPELMAAATLPGARTRHGARTCDAEGRARRLHAALPLASPRAHPLGQSCYPWLAPGLPVPRPQPRLL